MQDIRGKTMKQDLKRFFDNPPISMKIIGWTIDFIRTCFSLMGAICVFPLVVIDIFIVRYYVGKVIKEEKKKNPLSMDDVLNNPEYKVRGRYE
jgi:hypothetical protein